MVFLDMPEHHKRQKERARLDRKEDTPRVTALAAYPLCPLDRGPSSSLSLPHLKIKEVLEIKKKDTYTLQQQEGHRFSSTTLKPCSPDGRKRLGGRITLAAGGHPARLFEHPSLHGRKASGGAVEKGSPLQVPQPRPVGLLQTGLESDLGWRRVFAARACFRGRDHFPGLLSEDGIARPARWVYFTVRVSRESGAKKAGGPLPCVDISTRFGRNSKKTKTKKGVKERKRSTWTKPPKRRVILFGYNLFSARHS